MEKEDEKIAMILNTDDVDVSEENLDKYFHYLKSAIEKPCSLTGAEIFDWERPYIIGGWDKKEYEKLKKERAAYNDSFELVDFEEEIDECVGVLVKVKRKSDNKRFTLPLWDLEVVGEKSAKNYEVVSDYSSWMTNYR